jgi:hypothetical protein
MSNARCWRRRRLAVLAIGTSLLSGCAAGDFEPQPVAVSPGFGLLDGIPGAGGRRVGAPATRIADWRDFEQLSGDTGRGQARPEGVHRSMTSFGSVPSFSKLRARATNSAASRFRVPKSSP